jgi:hypothetical protein
MKKEDALTSQVATYLRLQYPKVLFTHIANERRTSPMHGAKLKRMGVRAGMPDILVFHQVWLTKQLMQCGLAIELKIKPNKPTDLQKECLTGLFKNGWSTHVIYDFQTAKQTIDNYLINQ